MRRDEPTRVIVGIGDSLAGLRALRLAVSEARRRAAALHAVRVLDFNSSAQFQAYEDRKAAAAEDIAQAFAKALGGFPADIEVFQSIVLGSPGRVLVEHAHRDEDLLIVGSAQRRWWRRLFHRSVARYCLAHATCPVLAVPPDTFARVATRKGLAKAISRDLSTLGG